MMALWDRNKTGLGQVVDLSIVEPLFSLLGPQATVFDQLGIVQERTGNAAPFTAPRNAYQSKDGVWLALSGSAQSIAERVAAVVGREDWLEEDWFQSHTGRLEHLAELDDSIGGWIGAHTREEVMAEFAKQEGAIAPIYTIADIFEDPQFIHRESITRVGHPELGSVAMANVVPKLSRTPGEIRFPGPTQIGADNADVLHELGLDDDEIEKLRDAHVI
jgi:crotonobetainyl-CoA:carnitine CoA-transferase CaiB-like acyl-CoA transferase